MAPREKAPREKAPGEKMEGGKTVDRAPVILNHLILCNNTLSDLHFGQVLNIMFVFKLYTVYSMYIAIVYVIRVM